MSLINQALKKEQIRRSGLANEAVAPMVMQAQASAARHQRERRNSLLLMGFAGSGILLVALVAAVIYYGSAYLEGVSNPESSPTSLASAAVEREIAPEPIEAKEETASPSPIAQIEAEPESVAVAETPTATIQEPVAAVMPETVEEPAAAIKAEADEAHRQKVQLLVDAFQFQGVRTAGANSRLLLNGRVYKLKDFVDRKSGIIFEAISSDALVFVDTKGYRYEKAL